MMAESRTAALLFLSLALAACAGDTVSEPSLEDELEDGSIDTERPELDGPSDGTATWAEQCPGMVLGEPITSYRGISGSYLLAGDPAPGQPTELALQAAPGQTSGTFDATLVSAAGESTYRRSGIYRAYRQSVLAGASLGLDTNRNGLVDRVYYVLGLARSDGGDEITSMCLAPASGGGAPFMLTRERESCPGVALGAPIRDYQGLAGSYARTSAPVVGEPSDFSVRGESEPGGSFACCVVERCVACSGW
jgi:hypothetical protein